MYKGKKRGLEARIRNIIDDYDETHEDDEKLWAPVAKDEWEELLTEEHFPGRKLPDGFPLTAAQRGKSNYGDLWGYKYRDERFPDDSKGRQRYDPAYEEVYDTVNEIRELPLDNRFTPSPPDSPDPEVSPEITRWPPLYIDGDSHKRSIPFRPATADESLGDVETILPRVLQQSKPWPAPIEIFPDNAFRSKDYRDLYTRKATRRISMSSQVSPKTKVASQLDEARSADTAAATEGQIDSLDGVDKTGATEGQDDPLDGVDTAGTTDAQIKPSNGAETAGTTDPLNGDREQNQVSPPNASQTEPANDPVTTQAVVPAKPKRAYRKRQPRARNAAPPVPTRVMPARAARTDASKRIASIAFAEEQQSEDERIAAPPVTTRVMPARAARTDARKRLASIAFAEEQQSEDERIAARIKAAKANSFRAKRQAKDNSKN